MYSVEQNSHFTGQVLPIGGIREKSLAAQRAGLKRVIMPRENEPDLAELPPETRRELEFVLVDSIDEVFEAAFDVHAALSRRLDYHRLRARRRDAAVVERAGSLRRGVRPIVPGRCVARDARA